jgi:hypothetical protein
VAGSLLALALAASSTAQARAPHRVVVIHGSQVVWSFHTASCVKTKGRFTAVLGGEVKNPDYAMAIVLDRFTGFHDYPVTLGPSGDSFMKLFGPNAVYSNIYAPPFPSPGAGRITFADGGRLMGVGFGPAMFTQDASDAVSLTGVVKCKYKKKRAAGRH